VYHSVAGSFELTVQRFHTLQPLGFGAFCDDRLTQHEERPSSHTPIRLSQIIVASGQKAGRALAQRTEGQAESGGHRLPPCKGWQALASNKAELHCLWQTDIMGCFWFCLGQLWGSLQAFGRVTRKNVSRQTPFRLNWQHWSLATRLPVCVCVGGG
jgi:hypothetical protein